MEFHKDGYFAVKSFGTHNETGLEIQLRATGLNVNAKLKEIWVLWDLCLVSPNGSVMTLLKSGKFRRFNGNVKKFDGLKNSAIGQGIKQMIEALDFSQISDPESDIETILKQE